MIQKLLGKIGLTSRETSVYLASLEIGMQPASVIAKKTNMNRVTTYQTFKKLIDKGLAYSVVRGGVNFFAVQEPSSLVKYIDKKRDRLEQTKEKLEEKLGNMSFDRYTGMEISSVRYYDGIDGISAIYDTVLRFDDPVQILSPTEKLPEDLQEYWRTQFSPGLLRQNIDLHMMSSGSKGELMGLGIYDIPNSRVFHVDELEQDIELILFGGGKVAFISYVHDLHGVIIENKALHSSLQFQIYVLRLFYEGKVAEKRRISQNTI